MAQDTTSKKKRPDPEKPRDLLWEVHGSCEGLTQDSGHQWIKCTLYVKAPNIISAAHAAADLMGLKPVIRKVYQMDETAFKFGEIEDE